MNRAAHLAATRRAHSDQPCGHEPASPRCPGTGLHLTRKRGQAGTVPAQAFTLVQQAAAEVGYLRDTADGQIVTTRIDLTRYDGDALELISLTPAEYARYIELARIVDDGEAATITVAVERLIPLATDDRKARKLCAELQTQEPLRTLGIMHSYADATHLPQGELREILVNIRDRASYQPARSDPDRKWWEDIIGDA